jgi:para-nitrobenzyl esterase
MTYFTNFAKTGDPNGGTLPKWPKYSEEGCPLIHFNSTVTAGPDALRGRYEFLEHSMPPTRF